MPTFKICCVDASIIVRLLIDSNDQLMQTLWKGWQRDRISLLAPELLLYEVTDALYQQQRQNRLSADLVGRMIKTARSLPIKLYSDATLHDDAHRMATELGLPAAYDAHYLATAERNGAAFWTSDKKLTEKIGGKLDWVNYLHREAI